MKRSPLSREKKVAALLTVLSVIVVAMNVLAELSRWNDPATAATPLLDAAEAFRLTSNFGALLLLLCAGSVARVGLSKKRSGDAFVLQWMFLALGFAALALIKATSIHTYALDFVRSVDVWIGATITVPAIAVVLLGALGIPYWKFLRALEPRLRTWLLVGGGIYLLGAIVMEAVTESLWYTRGRESLSYVAASGVEELLELIGCVVVIYVCSTYWRANREGEAPGEAGT